jgi:O-antigen chain-terminating methyltransferase
MSAAETNSELPARLGAIREQIRKRLERTVPTSPALPRPPIERLQEAASAARSLAAAIGTVNPRPPGLANGLVQFFKRTVTRALDWHVRPQRDFNQATAECFAKTAELLEATNQNLQALAASLEPFSRLYQELAEELDKVPERWDEQMKRQRWAYEGMLHRQSRGLTENLRHEFQEELRLLRQRVAAQAKASEVRATAVPIREAAAASQGQASGTPLLDYFQFERDFRGTEEEIRARQSFYAPFFRGRKSVLDLACGRGEFLELMRELKVTARGVDLDADMVGRCREKNLDVIQGDVFAHLAAIPDGSLDGIFSAQFVEHLPAELYANLITQCARKLAPGGVLAIETPNPECLAIFSQTFYLDPTHVRPIPPGQLRFLFAETGLTRITTHFLSPAGAGLPLIPPLTSRVIEADRLKAWNDAVARFNETFFGGMDYAVVGHRAGG